MKKFCLFLCLILILGSFSSCGESATEEVSSITLDDGSAVNIDINIKEKMFSVQTQDLLTNFKDNEGKIVRIVGYLGRAQDTKSGEWCYFVYRYKLDSTGCCYVPSMIEMIWEDSGKTYSQNDNWKLDKVLETGGYTFYKTDEWVEAVGTYGYYTLGGNKYAGMTLISLKDAGKVGKTYVS